MALAALSPHHQDVLREQQSIYEQGMLHNAQLQNAGILGAYDRMKRRHQRAHQDNPNPVRAAQKNKQVIEQRIVDADAKRRDRINVDDLGGILALANGGHRLSEDEVWSIFVQCNPDGYGYIKSKRVGEAIKLFGRNRRFYGEPPLIEQPGCQCVVS